MGHRVFISYASKDRARATAVCELLERHGISCWMAHRNIPPGVVWPSAISDAIDSASLMLLLISANANSSRHIGREVERADRKQMPVIPLRIEDVLPSEGIGYFISNVQWIDFFPDDPEIYWSALSFAINQELARAQVSSGRPLPLVQPNPPPPQNKPRASWSSLGPAKKIAAAIAGAALVVGVAAGLVTQVAALRDGVCKLSDFAFCDTVSTREDGMERVRLDKADFDQTALGALVRDAKTPAVRNEAQRRLDIIMAEQQGYESVENDIDGLEGFLSKGCVACLVKDRAEERLKDLRAERDQKTGRAVAGRETDSLDRAKFDEAELNALERDARTPAVRDEAQRRLDVIMVEQKGYGAVENDIDGLEGFLSRRCVACLVNDRAEERLKVLRAERDQKSGSEVAGRERDRLDSAKFDETALSGLARDAKTPAVRDEARHRLDVIATEKKDYEAVKTDKAGLAKFVAAPCEACLVQADARAQLANWSSEGGPARASASRPVGYAIFAIIDKKNNMRRKHFEIDGKPNARFPGPNDIVTVSREQGVPLRAIPFHWDIDAGEAVIGRDVVVEMALGQKAKVVGDLFISTDPNNGDQYAIAPISEVIGVDEQYSASAFTPQIAPGKVLGYAYIGYINDMTSEYEDRTFINQTRPSAIYPAPNDILVATKDVSLRSGPRRWDSAKQDYVDSKVVQKIKQGQSVSVAGDAILAKGGLSIWSPISAIDPR